MVDLSILNQKKKKKNHFPFEHENTIEQNLGSGDNTTIETTGIESFEKSSGSRTHASRDFPSLRWKASTREKKLNGPLDFPILSNAGLKRRREREEKRRGEERTSLAIFSFGYNATPGARLPEHVLSSFRIRRKFFRHARHTAAPQVDHTAHLTLLELQICGHPVCLTGGSVSIGSGNCLFVRCVTTSSSEGRKGGKEVGREVRSSESFERNLTWASRVHENRKLPVEDVTRGCSITTTTTTFDDSAPLDEAFED